MANKNNNELEKRNQAFLIYQDENGIARVNVRFESEQDPNRTHKKFLLVRQEGNRSGCQGGCQGTDTVLKTKLFG